MKLLILFSSLIVLIACQTSQISSKEKSDDIVFKQMLAEQEMVKKKVENDQKSDEQIFEEMLATEKAEADLDGETVETYQCCAQWLIDGTCAQELIPGCSQELDAQEGVQSLYFEVKAPNACCTGYAADGSCMHEIVPGCSQR